MGAGRPLHRFALGMGCGKQLGARQAGAHFASVSTACRCMGGHNFAPLELGQGQGLCAISATMAAGPRLIGLDTLDEARHIRIQTRQGIGGDGGNHGGDPLGGLL